MAEAKVKEGFRRGPGAPPVHRVRTGAKTGSSWQTIAKERRARRRGTQPQGRPRWLAQQERGLGGYS